MQKDSKFFDDISKMMSGATNMAFDMKRETEAVVARQMEAFLSKTSLVTREEFEAVKAMAVKAREENDALHKKLNELLKANTASESEQPATGKTTTRRKTTAKTENTVKADTDKSS